MPEVYGKTRPEKSPRALTAAMLLMCMLLGMLNGCRSPQQPDSLTAIPYRTDPWDTRYPGTSAITTPNYRIFTDIQDPHTIRQLVQVLEGANREYRAIAPPVTTAVQPLRCYIFSRRQEWAAFTNNHAGEDAAVYLRINRGAYTIDDWFVAFWLGDEGTFSVVAHEGWHQFAGRHFVARMPPSLEEGIGCMFETIEWVGGIPRWQRNSSPSREKALRKALESGRLWSMAELLALHAGDAIHMPRERVDTYYAQNWAMAKFLLDDNSPYRPAMQRYFADLARGTVYRPAIFASLKPRDWHPNLSLAQMEHYLGTKLSKLEEEYRSFCMHLAARAGYRE